MRTSSPLPQETRSKMPASVRPTWTASASRSSCSPPTVPSTCSSPPRISAAPGHGRRYRRCFAGPHVDTLVVPSRAGDVSHGVARRRRSLRSPGSFSQLVDEYNVATREHLATIPTGGPNAIFAMLTRRHMRQHKLTRAVYGHVAVAQRGWARGNPNAAYRTPLTLAEYLRAPMVSDPLGRYDCVPVVAGAAAVLVSSRNEGRGVADCVRCSPDMEPAAKTATAFAQGLPT